MGISTTGRKIYKSLNGKVVELDKLIMKNETVLAVGNVKVNARGDELGPGGKIIKRVDPTTEYNSVANAVPASTISRKPDVQPSPSAPTNLVADVQRGEVKPEIKPEIKPEAKVEVKPDVKVKD